MRKSIIRFSDVGNKWVRGLGSFLVFSLIAFSVLGCGLLDQEEDKVVIRVGSRQITVDDLKRDSQFFSPGIDSGIPKEPPIKDRLVEQVIDHYLILEYGKEKGISLPDGELEAAIREIKEGYTEEAFNDALLRGYVDLEGWKERLREQLLAHKIVRKVTEDLVSPSYDEIKKYFETHRNEFRSPRMVRFRQIVTRTREEAETLLGRVHKGEDMGELAGEYSIAPEAERGGEVGWVAQGHLDESMEKALFSTGVGKTSPIVETPYGYHIFQVISARPEGTRELPEVIQEIEARVLIQRRQAFFKKWLHNLRAQFKVDVNQDLLSRLELS